MLLRTILVIDDASFRLKVECADTEQIEYHLREIVRHEGAVNGALNPLHLLRMCGSIAGRDVYHEGDVELATHGAWVICLDIGTSLLHTEIVDLLAMVGKIDDDGVAV